MHIIDLELSYHYSPGRSLIPECTLYINKTQNRGKVINKLVKLQRRCNKKCLTCSTFQSASETISSAKNSTLSFSRLGLVHLAVSVQSLKVDQIMADPFCVWRISSATNPTLNKIVNFSPLRMVHPAVSCVQKLIRLWPILFVCQETPWRCWYTKMTNRKYDMRQRPWTPYILTLGCL